MASSPKQLKINEDFQELSKGALEEEIRKQSLNMYREIESIEDASQKAALAKCFAYFEALTMRKAQLGSIELLENLRELKTEQKNIVDQIDMTSNKMHLSQIHYCEQLERY